VSGIACQNRQDTSTLKVLADYREFFPCSSESGLDVSHDCRSADAKANSTGSYVDYGFHMIITNPSESVVKDEIPVLMQEGISSCKLFVGATA
jgi:dihydropyrimidinase